MVEVDRPALEARLAALRAEVEDPGAGIHGPSTVTWRITREVAVFLGGGRAVLLQLAHPWVAQAIADHSRTRADVTGRVRRTFGLVYTMAFGPLDQAEAAARRLHGIHARITGVLGQGGPGFPAGSRYAANDVDALLWVWATLVDSALRVYQHVHGPLPERDRDRYVGENHRFAALFGIPAAALPARWSTLAAYVDDTAARLPVLEAARTTADFLLGRPDQNAAARVLEAVTAELLPAAVRDGFGLRDDAGSRRLAARVWAGARLITPRLPGLVRFAPAYTQAVRRLAGRPPSSSATWLEARWFAAADWPTRGAGPR